MKRLLRSKRAEAAAKAAIALVALVALGAASWSTIRDLAPPSLMRGAAHLPHVHVALPAASLATPTEAAPAKPRADRALDRAGYTLAGAGALFVPSSFHSADGAFDLLVYFHGNAELVAESVAAAGLSAIVLVVNLGIGSGAYETRYAWPAMLDYDIGRAVDVARARGLEGARVRRLALGAWSAGYGGIVRLLQSEDVFRRTSAVLLCDAMHAGFSDKRGRVVDMDRIDPFVRFAREASLGRKLFVMTHSEVGEFRYATTTETSSALLAALGIFRARKTDWPDRPTLPLARSVMSAERWLQQESDARKGELHVSGYRGFREDDHIAHLAQMSTTVLPELVRYWAKTSAAE